MHKNRIIRVRITETEFNKLEALRGSKTVSETVRKLISAGHKTADEEIKQTATLIAKLEQADLVEIGKKLDAIMSMLANDKDQTPDGHAELLSEMKTAKTIAALIAYSVPAVSPKFRECFPKLSAELAELGS